MKKILVLAFVQLCLLQLNAQELVKGKVVDEQTNETVLFADISVFEKENKQFVDTFYTDENGNFEFELNQNPTAFYLEIESIGYESQTYVIENQNPILIKLKTDKSIELSAAVISAKKKAISIKGDKIIYDVEQMGISDGNNGLETMQQLPGISLDKDENLKFRGSTGIQIMINGKKSMLQGDALREFIRSLKGDDIKSVEIISQPSARYEASGTTGILNIVLKRNISQTLGGNIYTYAGYGEYFKHQTGGRFFYNDEKWSINASGSYYKGKSFNDREVNQTIELENGQRNILQTNYWLPETESKSFNLGVERKLNKNQLISTEWQIYTERGTELTNGKTLDYLNSELQNEVNLLKNVKTPIDQISGNLFYNFTSDSLKTKIDAQINYSYYEKSINGFQRNDFSSGAFNQLDGLNKTNYNLMNAQVDWNQKLSERLNLEAGAKFSYVDMDYFNQYTAEEGNNFIIPDSLMVNDFLYKEKLTSAYSQLNYTIEKWTFLAGLRMENYNYEAISQVNNQTNKDNYTNWFPSASVSYQNDNHQYRLSYSRRISRPSYLGLNPYYQYLDAYSIEKGNPALKPEFYDSFEINYIYKNSLSFGLYGYLYKDGFVNVIDYQDSENYNIIYESNASSGSRFGFSASIPYELGKWWTMQFSLDAYLSDEKSEIPNYAYEGNGYGYEVNMYHRFNLPKSWIFTLSGFLSGRNQTPTGYRPLLYDFSTSVKKSFMEDKLEFAAGCSNILKKSMYNNYSTVDNVKTHWINKWETRRFYLQLTYRFGGNKEKKVKNTSLDEEKSRM
ncbi:outer membrane beta-barrel protein [Moheibacter sediminis]|uniref:Outer membrane receptor proteins, mostly Fe transport n=1 Tax=Moheibacter sediminis TaxID=1434700 RepID=A0A1W1ZCE2_9FLAO|nr:outer membrane beta-barrel protein [Moheibacter sediminis]SMC45942.1 Outer membrane receptor proteins, mostly Fe transport [Moheibacter sediminis]